MAPGKICGKFDAIATQRLRVSVLAARLCEHSWTPMLSQWLNTPPTKKEVSSIIHQLAAQPVPSEPGTERDLDHHQGEHDVRGPRVIAIELTDLGVALHHVDHAAGVRLALGGQLVAQPLEALGCVVVGRKWEIGRALGARGLHGLLCSTEDRCRRTILYT
jgi:hypothetical protein